MTDDCGRGGIGAKSSSAFTRSAAVIAAKLNESSAITSIGSLRRATPRRQSWPKLA